MLALLGCQTVCDEGFEAVDGNCYPAEEDAQPERLSAIQVLRRTSLDLNGVLPTVEALDAVAANPAALASHQRDILDDPRLEARLVELLGERWHTLVDDFSIQAQEFQVEEYPFERSVGEEPLRLMARIGVEDRPWTDIVLADHTMANDMLVSVFPMEREAGDGWTVARYLDGRPPAGVLATNGFFWRYRTTVSNANRGRAAAVMKLFVCDDLALRPVSFEADALVGGTDVAIRESPACTSCHDVLEPAASALFGWYWFEPYNALEASTYHPEREPLGESFLGVTGGWYGHDVDGLASLGAAVASDARFDRCQARAFADALLGDDLGENRERQDALVEDWQDKGLVLRALLEDLVTDDLYAQTALSPLASDQLATVIEDLTGFVWTAEGVDLLRSDTTGYRTMAAGVDGRFVTRASSTPSLTWTLVVKRLAEASSAYAVENGTFFTVADLGTTPEDPEFAEQVEAWAWRLMGVEGDVEGLTQLWWAVEEQSGSDEAWVGVMSAMLRDPELVMY
jgi:hypothetical protein